jgi:hypothetical protein
MWLIGFYLLIFFPTKDLYYMNPFVVDFANLIPFDAIVVNFQMSWIKT